MVCGPRALVGFAVVGFVVVELLLQCEMCYLDAANTEGPNENAQTNSNQSSPWVTVKAGRIVNVGDVVRLEITFEERGTKDGFDVTAKSEDERVAVSVATVEGNDYDYVARFTPRAPGQYRVCINYYWASALGIAAHCSDNATTYDYEPMKVDKKSITANWCTPKQHCIVVNVAGAPLLPRTVCPSDWEHSMEGSWLMSPSEHCTPGYCEGDLKFQNTKRWIWVPKSCYLRLYNRVSAWGCLDKKSLLWFGDSTLKQPATNLLEMVLGVPVLSNGRSFNWYNNTCQGSKWSAASQCPTPVALRRWDGHRINPHNKTQFITVRYVWGGAKTVDLPPPQYKKGALQLLLDEKANKHYRAVKDMAHAAREKPDFVFVNSFAWYPLRHKWVVFNKETTKGLEQILAKFSSASLHFDTSHAYCSYDKVEQEDSVCQSYLLEKRQGFIGALNSRLFGEQVLPKLRSRRRRVTAINRYLMSQPFSDDHSHCQFGLHYGSHKSYCNIFAGLHDPRSCIRDWKVDKFEIQIWLNKMCPLGSATAAPLPYDIEAGVP